MNEFKSEALNEVVARLNPQQKEAVMNTVGPELIVAGAGSGKTSVLTARIAVLLEQGFLPERILALTFTKKAADEMCKRIEQLEGQQAKRLCMGTFHSVFIRLIRPYASFIGYQPNFTILDEDDSLNCLKRCIDDIIGQGRPPKDTWSKAQAELFKQQDEPYKPKSIAARISMLKDQLILPYYYQNDKAFESARIDDKRAQRPLFAKIYTEYVERCRRQGTMDFDDILVYMNILLSNFPDIKERIAGSFDHILVDEYQDTNVAQYSMLRWLTEHNRNICVVGDDSQSIYAFRGARIENIFKFNKDYEGCRIYKLETNYRSKGNIVGLANNLIANNENRIPKTCVSFEADSKGKIFCKSLYNENAEANYIAQSILGKKEDSNGKLSFKDFAILYRTNSQSRVLEDALVKNNIPYTIYSGTSFFERLEVKDTMAYFRLAINPHDDEAFRRVVNKPVRGVGPAAMDKLMKYATYYGVTLWKALDLPNFGDAGLTPSAYRGLMNFKENVTTCIELAQTRSAYEAALNISELTGFYASYKQDRSEESQNRADNIRELVDSVKSYEEEVKKNNEGVNDAEKTRPTLLDYIQNVMLLSNADTKEKDGDAVSLMTVHTAKGLEFECVTIAGLEKNLFPLEIDKNQDELEEERRLFYVAMTRAKSDLLLTYAQSRMKFGKRNKQKPSRFLEELIKAKNDTL